MKTWAAVMAVWGLAGMGWGQNVIFVDAAATGANNGTGWTDAFIYLQDGLGAAAAGTEVRVAGGVYRPDRGSGVTRGDRGRAFVLKNGVAIRGGYAGTGAADPNERDITAHETILSGDLNGNDKAEPNANTLLTEPNRAENSYHVTRSATANLTAVLDGVTIKGGQATGSSWPDFIGGGMYNDGGGPRLMQCTFASNAAVYFGGGMYNYSSDPFLTGCRLRGNWAKGGGGMFNGNSSVPRLEECALTGNGASENGGGFYNSYSNAVLTGCELRGNLAGISGGGGYNYYSHGFKLVESTVRENRAGYGGGIYHYHSDGRIEASEITGNRGTLEGGGVYQLGSKATLAYSRISINTADKGGGVYGKDNGGQLADHCLISGNRARSYGGGMYLYSGSAALGHCTMTGNRAWKQGSLICVNGASTAVSFSDCILWQNDPNAIANAGKIESWYSDVEGGWAGEGNLALDPNFAANGYWDPNTQDDPNGYYDPNGEWIPIGWNDPNNDFWVEGDYHLRSEAGRVDPNLAPAGDVNGDQRVNLGDVAVLAGNWLVSGEQLAGDITGDGIVDSTDLAVVTANFLRYGVWVADGATSRCIDAGNPGHSLEDEPDEAGNLRLDLGFYGGTAEASGAPAGWSLRADCSNDGQVDMKDLLILIRYWLKEGQDGRGDLNRDGGVNLMDLAIMQEDWLGETTVWFD